MAGFCGNCGAPLDDDALVCGQCGTPIDGISNNRNGKGKNNNSRRKIKIFFVIFILVAMAFTGFKIYSSFTGPKGMIKKIMKAYKDYDIDGLVSLSSDMYYYSTYDKYVEEYFSNAIGESIDRFEESVGHSYKLNYEITETYKVSQRKKEEILNNIEMNFPDFDIELIKELYIADIKIKATQGSKSLNDTLKITLSQEGGSWKLLYLE